MSKKYKCICIGVDQSYKRTGISFSADGILLKVYSIDLSKKEKWESRKLASDAIERACKCALSHAENVVLILERTRMFSRKFVSIPYIKSMGALNAVITDAARKYGIDSWSVDTRCWKAEVVGTSKGKTNRFGVPEEKWPAVELVISKGFKDSVKLPVEGRRSKSTFTDEAGKKWEYDNDACDSACMSLFWFVGDQAKLILED